MSAVRFEVYDTTGGFVQDGIQFGVNSQDPEMAAMEVAMMLDLPFGPGWSIRAWLRDQSGKSEPEAVLTMDGRGGAQAAERTPPYQRMREPVHGDVVAIDNQPEGPFIVEAVRGYTAGEGWGVDLVEAQPSDDGPPMRFFMCLHEAYVNRPWWQYVNS